MFWLLLLQVFALTYGYFDVAEINNVKYDIDILDSPVTSEQGSGDGDVLLASKFGQQYQCSFAGGQQEVDWEEKRREEIALEKGIVELLKPIKDEDCLTVVKGWWTYELCYGVHIRQYHVEDGVAHDSNYLGFYQSDFDWSSVKEGQAKSKPLEARYHSQEYVNGTVCDLTGKLRRSQVRYYCDLYNGDYLSNVEELETCVYTLTVFTARICDHPYLKLQKRAKAVPIMCHPLLTADEYKEYTELKESSDQTDMDDEYDESEDYSPNSPTHILQNIVTKSLARGLDNYFNGERVDLQIKIRKLKTVKMKQKQIGTEIKDFMSEAKGQDNTGDKQVDKDEKAEDSTETTKTTDEKGDVVDDDDDDLTLLKEFEQVLDEIVKSDEHLEEVKLYKDEIQREMNAQFVEIINEAEEELNNAGMIKPSSKPAVLEMMAKTLEKLLKRLQEKEATGNKKEFYSMMDKAAIAALDILKSTSLSADSDGVQQQDTDEPVNTDGDDDDDDDGHVMMKDSDEDDKEEEEEEEEHNRTKKPSSGHHDLSDGNLDEDDDVEDDEDALSLEYEINYGDDKPVDVKSDQKQADMINDQAGTVPAAEHLNEQAQTLEDRQHSGVSDPDSDEDENLPKSREVTPSSEQVSESKEPEDSEETVVYKDDTIKIRVKTRHYIEETDTEEGSEVKSSKVGGEEEASSGELNKEDHAKMMAKERTAVLRNAEKRVQEAVERKLSESGVKTSGQTIQVKIFTTDNYMNGDGENSLFHTNGALNRMLVAVLGSNTEEMVEAKRQDKLKTNYGFVWKKEKIKKNSQKSDNH